MAGELESATAICRVLFAQVFLRKSKGQVSNIVDCDKANAYSNKKRALAWELGFVSIHVQHDGAHGSDNMLTMSKLLTS